MVSRPDLAPGSSRGLQLYRCWDFLRNVAVTTKRNENILFCWKYYFKNKCGWQKGKTREMEHTKAGGETVCVRRRVQTLCCCEARPPSSLGPCAAVPAHMEGGPGGRLPFSVSSRLRYL